MKNAYLHTLIGVIHTNYRNKQCATLGMVIVK